MFYENLDERYFVFMNFFQEGFDNGQVCIYGHCGKELRFELPPESEDVINIFNICEGDKDFRVEHLEKFLVFCHNTIDSSEGITGVRIGVDIEKVTDSNMDFLFALLDQIHGNMEVKVWTVLSFNLNDLDIRQIRKVLKISKNVTIIAGKDGNGIVFNQPDIEDKDFKISEDSISAEVLEETVKKSLNIILLSLIKRKSMSGFEIIKEIVTRFNVLLSQGTVYPVLYNFEDLGYFNSKLREDNKTKIYFPSAEGAKFIDEQINEFKIIHNNIRNMVLKGL